MVPIGWHGSFTLVGCQVVPIVFFVQEEYISIVEGVDWRKDEVVSMFARVGESNEWKYPPKTRIVQVGSVREWVWLHSENVRWDAVHSSGKVVGSIQLNLPSATHDVLRKETSNGHLLGLLEDAGKYLKKKLDVEFLGVIERFAVDPQFHMRGCGRLLLKTALNRIESMERIAVLSVLATQKEALDLYVSEGGVVIGETTGLSGLPIWHVCFAGKM